ncbi:hypothetical protein LCGC14_0417640 [marine sediment metagenome]|uniref:Methyltransferase FkbM domain-containing protein n=1 Tax=marine sediment metagenome TaxID=412755 RepID=A0A0F9W0T3_9ZZZZ
MDVNKVLDELKLGKGDLFIDLGAHQGVNIQACIEREITVVAFEPHQMLFRDYLYPGFHRNPLVTLEYAAAWREDSDEQRLYLKNRKKDDDTGSSLVKYKTNLDKQSWMPCRTINIGKYLVKLDQDITILKIDTEGSEWDIINSVLDEFDYSRIQHWYVEDHNTKIPDKTWIRRRGQTRKRLDDLGIELMSWE